MMVSKYRTLRLRCQIPLKEVAAEAKISHQRLSQIELKRFGTYPQNPERLINALENIINQRKKELEVAENICKNERDTLFNSVMEGELNG